MITINFSWSLGLCLNKSLDPFESPVPPHRQSGRYSVDSRTHSVPAQLGRVVCKVVEHSIFRLYKDRIDRIRTGYRSDNFTLKTALKLLSLRNLQTISPTFLPENLMIRSIALLLPFLTLPNRFRS